jgi:hypothetical protein
MPALRDEKMRGPYYTAFIHPLRPAVKRSCNLLVADYLDNWRKISITLKTPKPRRTDGANLC